MLEDISHCRICFASITCTAKRSYSVNSKLLINYKLSSHCQYFFKEELDINHFLDILRHSWFKVSKHILALHLLLLGITLGFILDSFFIICRTEIMDSWTSIYKTGGFNASCRHCIWYLTHSATGKVLVRMLRCKCIIHFSKMKHWIFRINNWKKYLQAIICFLVLGLKISHHLWHLFGSVLVCSQDRINALAAAVGGEPGASEACLGCLSIAPGAAEKHSHLREGGSGLQSGKSNWHGGVHSPLLDVSACTRSGQPVSIFCM